MTLLGGLFTRKNKNKQDARSVATTGSNTADDLPSNVSSPTTSYVIADKSSPSSPNGKSNYHSGPSRDNPRSHVYPSPGLPSSSSPASSSKLRLPFSRKKSAIGGTELSAKSTPNVNDDYFYTAPRPAYSGRLSTSSAVSEVESSDGRRLRPPPSKSAIFAAYTDPQSALSTHSLPNQGFFARSSSPSSPPAVPQLGTPPSKRPSLFHWSKTSTPPMSKKSQLHDANTLPNLTQDKSSSRTSAEPSSFNLKSFRHMRPPSPTRSESSHISLSTPIPRPRGPSVNSDSSQRISVAAFREAQARRSLAGSPSPSLGCSPSPLPQVLAHPSDASRARPSPRPSRSSPQIKGNTQRRKSGAPVGYTSESDESLSSDEEDESENDTLGRQRTVTTRTNKTVVRDRMGKEKAKSEMGHGTTYYSPLRQDERSPNRQTSPRSHLGHGWTPQSMGTRNDEQNPLPRSQSSLSVYGEGSRPRASASTSALSPSAAAKRASVIASGNASTGIDVLSEYKRVSRHVRDSSTHSNPAAPANFASVSGKLGQTRTIATPSMRPQSPADADSDSDDDAPLAKFLGPNRPGSTLSSYSNLHSRSTGNVSSRSTNRAQQKPLIDIGELTGGKRIPPSKVKSTDGFTLGQQTLISEGNFSASPANSSTPVSTPLTSKFPPGNFISPPSTPAKEMKELISGPSHITNMPAPTRRDTSPDILQQRKDILSERLSRVLQKSVGSGSSSGSDGFSGSNQDHTRRQDALAEDRDRSPSSRLGGGPANSASTVGGLPHQDEKRNTSPRSTLNHVPASSPVLRGHRPSESSATLKPSPPDEELALMLGAAGIKFISRAGESTSEEEEEEESESSDSESSSSGRNKKQVVTDKESSPDRGRIAPIPIKQRAPPPAFSVTSRPTFPRNAGTEGANPRTSLGESSRVVSGQTTRTSIALGESLSSLKPASTPTPTSRKRSSTLIPSSTTSSSVFGSSSSSSGSKATSTSRANGGGNPNTPGSPSQANIDRATALKAAAAGKSSAASSPTLLAPGMPPRQRSSTMLPSMPTSASPTSSKPPSMPNRPFAARGNSPASSTGDSSSGRAPLTPRDGSDIGRRSKGSAATQNEWSGGASGLTVTSKSKGKQHAKRRSVSFEDETGGMNTDEDREVKRNERRRVEARAAIELGNVVNGPGPVMNDEDEDMPINQTLNARMSALNPMMNMGGQMPMQQQVGFVGNPGLGSPWGNMNMGMNMGPQSMLSPAQFMIPPPADQNFMAAHQHAMMIAKQAYQMAVAQQAMAAAADEWERGSTVGFSGSTVGFSGGSVYGGGGTSPGYGMMGGMGMMPLQNQWSTGSMYGGMGGGTRSEYGGGGGGGGGNWSSSRSSYGESFGPSPDRFARNRTNQRESGHYPPVPPIPSSHEQQAKNAPRSRTTSQPSSAGRGGVRKAPPSSWKAGV